MTVYPKKEKINLAGNIDVIRVVPEAQTVILANMIVNYASEHGFTSRNIMESTEMALDHMQKNAVLVEDTLTEE